MYSFICTSLSAASNALVQHDQADRCEALEQDALRFAQPVVDGLVDDPLDQAVRVMTLTRPRDA